MVDVAKNGTAGRQQLAISAETAQAFKEVCKTRAVGRSMNDAANRIIEWFNRQPAPVQTAVTSDVDAGMERQYADALRRLADEVDPPQEPTGRSIVIDRGLKR